MGPELAWAHDASLTSLAGAFRELRCDALQIRPLAFRSMLNLRGPAADERFIAEVSAALDLELPLRPNRWCGSADRAAIWLGPDEWLIVAADGDATAAESAIRQARPSDPWLSVVDLSGSYTSLLLSGRCSRDLLAKGCPIDVHPDAFAAGDCAQSILARSRVLIRALDRESVELQVRNSFALYVGRWLLDAAVEFTVSPA